MDVLANRMNNWHINWQVYAQRKQSFELTVTHWALIQDSISCGVLAAQLAWGAQKGPCAMYLLDAVDQSPLSGWSWIIFFSLVHKQHWRL